VDCKPSGGMDSSVNKPVAQPTANGSRHYFHNGKMVDVKEMQGTNASAKNEEKTVISAPVDKASKVGS